MDGNLGNVMWLVLCVMNMERGVCQVCRNRTFSELTEGNFTGHLNNIFVTNGGRLCRKWSEPPRRPIPGSQNLPSVVIGAPQIHPSDFWYDKTIDEAQDYCRPIDSEYWWNMWCFITDPAVKSESCNRRICREPHCRDKDLANYSGTVSQTNAKLTCQSWSSQTPHKHPFDTNEYFPMDASIEAAHNYCRNVGNDDLPWCFTTDPRIRWQYCDAIICNVTGSQCVAFLTSSSGWLSSFDSNADGRYDHDLDCLWTIMAPENMVILLDVLNLDVEKDPGCVHDFIEVYEPDFSHGVFCNESMLTITSRSNLLYVRFHSDDSGVKTGLNATYIHVPAREIYDKQTTESMIPSNSDQSSDQNSDQSSAENGDQTINQSGDQSSDQNGDQSSDQNGDQTSDQSGDQRSDQNGDQNNDEKSKYRNRAATYLKGSPLPGVFVLGIVFTWLYM